MDLAIYKMDKEQPPMASVDIDHYMDVDMDILEHSEKKEAGASALEPFPGLPLDVMRHVFLRITRQLSDDDRIAYWEAFRRHPVIPSLLALPIVGQGYLNNFDIPRRAIGWSYRLRMNSPISSLYLFHAQADLPDVWEYTQPFRAEPRPFPTDRSLIERDQKWWWRHVQRLELIYDKLPYLRYHPTIMDQWPISSHLEDFFRHLPETLPYLKLRLGAGFRCPHVLRWPPQGIKTFHLYLKKKQSVEWNWPVNLTDLRVQGESADEGRALSTLRTLPDTVETLDIDGIRVAMATLPRSLHTLKITQSKFAGPCHWKPMTTTPKIEVDCDEYTELEHLSIDTEHLILLFNVEDSYYESPEYKLMQLLNQCSARLRSIETNWLPRHWLDNEWYRVRWSPWRPRMPVQIRVENGYYPRWTRTIADLSAYLEEESDATDEESD